MTYTEVQSRIWSNALSNYVRTAAGILVGLGTFRLLYQHLGREEFGFWSLLWSVFGYGVLLDFGFGFAAQKRVAELSVSRDWQRLSQVLSTILFFYLGVAAVMMATVALGADSLVRFFEVSEARHAEFSTALILFFAAIGLAFPLGIFPEILRGQQRISLANNIITACMLVRLALIGWAVHAAWSFTSILVTALVFTLLPDVICAAYALRHMPEVRLSPALFSSRMIRDTMAFSIFAYISTASNILLSKTDQIVLGATLSVSAITLYQAGAKVAEVFAQFTKQLQDTFSPAAAHLHACGNHAALQQLLLNGTRWSALIATPLYLLCAMGISPLLRLLTGDAHLSQETYTVAQTLLFWFYTSTLTHSVSKRVYMMTGHERRLMWLGLGESLANVAFSVALVLTFRSVTSVALGSLLPTLAFGWLLLWPWMARDLSLTSWQLARTTLLPSLLGCLPGALILAVPHFVTLQASAFWPTHIITSALAALTMAGFLWRLALTPGERAAVRSRLPSLRSKKLSSLPTAC